MLLKQINLTPCISLHGQHFEVYSVTDNNQDPYLINPALCSHAIRFLCGRKKHTDHQIEV